MMVGEEDGRCGGGGGVMYTEEEEEEEVEATRATDIRVGTRLLSWHHYYLRRRRVLQ